MNGSAGACNKITALDDKKRLDSEKIAFSFRSKYISVAGLDDEILKQIHKFPYPIQKLIVSETAGVMTRIDKGKLPPGLAVSVCHCIFFRRYLLPCRHIFHEHMYGTTKILTDIVWKKFQDMFEEAGFEVYECSERVEVPLPVQTQGERDAEARRLEVNELMERVRNTYWRMEEGEGEGGNVGQTAAFIERLKETVETALE